MTAWPPPIMKTVVCHPRMAIPLQTVCVSAETCAKFLSSDMLFSQISQPPALCAGQTIHGSLSGGEYAKDLIQHRQRKDSLGLLLHACHQQVAVQATGQF